MDLYLKAADKATMDDALVAAGLARLEDETLIPEFGVSLDIIGSITRVTGLNRKGKPITVTYPEWHVNARVPALTEAQEEALASLKVDPPQTPFRVWGGLT